jgi:hypothetical protein
MTYVHLNQTGIKTLIIIRACGTYLWCQMKQASAFLVVDRGGDGHNCDEEGDTDDQRIMIVRQVS